MSQHPPNSLYCEDCCYKQQAERNAMAMLLSASNNSQSAAIALLNEALTRLGELDAVGEWWSDWIKSANAVVAQQHT